MPRTLTDDEVTRLKVALARISRLVDRQVSGGGLTRTQLSVLGTVSRLGPLGVGELAATEGLNPTMLSRVIGKLEADGLLARSPDPADRRAVLVQVTPAGEELHEGLRRDRTRLFASGLAALPEDQADRLLLALPAIEALATQMRAPAEAASASDRDRVTAR
ncbi:MarR family winged helix-turn-helix transcriptional regulator [Rhodococcus tukisamuensis]|uniref:DNA-binding transcriptional regulator, MarR family n=1 Tax=Rhodococcus tukisamuensis TaxID=168276 RepID=A0A1G6N1N9_9NOCA|nr:MarR family transcriptional regulator [Rhodococcus tukisamuensis]SDC61367.1 DNA-binding transcriptional regulator, MarR family [Rhodococcus tukisamuensis]